MVLRHAGQVEEHFLREHVASVRQSLPMVVVHRAAEVGHPGNVIQARRVVAEKFFEPGFGDAAQVASNAFKVKLLLDGEKYVGNCRQSDEFRAWR